MFKMSQSFVGHIVYAYYRLTYKFIYLFRRIQDYLEVFVFYVYQHLIKTISIRSLAGFSNEPQINVYFYF